MTTPSRACAALACLLFFASSACSEGGQGGSRSIAQSAAAAAQTSADAPGACRLKVGWDPWEPYQFVSAVGQMTGLDVELTSAILRGAACELQFAEGRWATLMHRLQRGDVDVLTGATRTPARETFAYFSDPYRSESFVLYVRKNDPGSERTGDLQTLLDTGFRLGVTEQYAYGERVDALQENPRYSDQFIGATSRAMNYQRLLDLEIDGFLENPGVAGIVIRRKGLYEEIAATAMPIHAGEVALMFSKTSVDPRVVARVNASLAALRESGEYQKILDRYLN